jgi:hypothetical protein
MLCKVSKCRFNSSHVTKGHKCGKCKKYGHGEIECNNYNEINKLKEFYHQVIENKCTFGGCQYSHLHTTDAHHCTKCDARYHSPATCINIMPPNHERLVYIDNQLSHHIKNLLPSYPSYTIIAREMGSYICVRRLVINAPLEELYVGPDDLEYQNLYTNFINGYAFIKLY